MDRCSTPACGTTHDAFIRRAVRRAPAGRLLNRSQSGTIATYRIYETAEGWICIAARTVDEWTRLCGVLGRPELASVERFSSYHGRVDARDELGAIFEPIFRSRTTAQ